MGSPEPGDAAEMPVIEIVDDHCEALHVEIEAVAESHEAMILEEEVRSVFTAVVPTLSDLQRRIDAAVKAAQIMLDHGEAVEARRALVEDIRAVMTELSERLSERGEKPAARPQGEKAARRSTK